jgi:CBS domain containing-hemolysin-like protein
MRSKGGSGLDDLSGDEKEMIKGVVELSETTVKEVMVPRIDVVFIDIDGGVEEAIRAVCDCGHSRIPVYRDTIDQVVGILHVKDLFKAMARKEDIDLAKLIRKPYFIPESKRLDSLLMEFKRRHIHIAIAVDEYGGVSGIVCLEDVIEEIVGEIQDEFDNEREDIVELGKGVWLCDARVNLEILNEELGLDLPLEGADTLGGFVFELFGKIPVRYEKASRGPLEFVVQDMDGHKIHTVKIVRREEQP